MSKTTVVNVGDKFGRLTYLGEAGRMGVNRMVKCKCVCGKEKVIRLTHLVSGKIQSCGCLRDEKIGKLGLTHGLSYTRTFKKWGNMRNRCSNKNNQGYRLYGERGIKVCKRWDNFVNFLEDMGEAPIDKSIDRINVNGNYCKENCRWATLKEQANNKRNNRWIEYNGEKKTLTQWANQYNMDCRKLWLRLKNGWDIKRALET